MEIWLEVGGADGPAAEVAVVIGAEHTVAELAAALADELDIRSVPEPHLYVHRLRCQLEGEDLVSESGLRFGDSVTVAPRGWLPREHDATEPSPPLVVVSVVGGPGTGQRVPLAVGDHVIGRSRRSDVVIEDPTLSGRHLLVAVGEDGLLISDLDSANGTFVDGAPVVGELPIRFGTVVEAAHSLVRFDAPSEPVASLPDVAEGLLRFNRQPRVARFPPKRSFVLGPAPNTVERRRLPMVSALGPLIFGIPILGLAIASKNTTMMAMGAVMLIGSPLMALASHLEDRRSGRRTYDQARRAYEREVDTLAGQMERSLAEEGPERRAAAPDAPDLLERAISLRPDLWERRPDDPDFLAVSVGWADQESNAEFLVSGEGDETLRSAAGERLEPLLAVTNVPAIVSIRDAGVIGLSGEAAATAGCARWMVAQLATLHSPRDLLLAAAVDPEEADDWAWISWLPHARDDGSLWERDSVATDPTDGADLVHTVTQAVRLRLEERRDLGRDGRPQRPEVVVILSERLALPRASLTTLLEDGPSVGIYTMWLGGRRDRLPGTCGAVVEAMASPPTCTVTFPRTGLIVPSVVLDQFARSASLELARSLASVKDVTAGGSRGQVPRSLDLLDLLAMPTPSSERVRLRWEQGGHGVAAPVGVSAGGTFHLDLRNDGPHALVGGTTGAGKSELLQTFVAALAATHRPDRVTFLLVDYKGGAAFKDAAHLPHTVGLVTDLDGHLVNRALISLNAELRYREHLLRDHGARDLLEMERRVPEVAPPTLILIVDEFASLAKELPDFVDGVVNVAQRGRSLGIHMILATQRPAGAVNDNIRANTNLRIALRMNDVADSEDVINARDAALLPRSLPGRAMARTGQTELTEVQIAYVGGHSAGGNQAVATIEVARLVRGRRMAGRPGTVQVDESSTDLQLLVRAIDEAAADAQIPPPRPPWVPPLPPVLPRSELAVDPELGVVAFGLVDVPDQQARRPWSWDIEREGNLLVFGASGTGKTTLLRTLAVDLASNHRPDQVHLYGLDFASRGLAGLAALPHVGSVVSGDDPEAVRSLISMLNREMATRRELLARSGASKLSEHERLDPTGVPPRIVVLLDGFAGFTAAFETVEAGAWLDRVHRVVAEGRPLGIHLVMTAEARSSVSHNLLSIVPSRVVLRLGDEDEYSTLGLDGRATRGVALVPGRGFVGPTLEVQVALIGPDPAGDAQTRLLAEIGADLRAEHPDLRAPQVATLPETVVFEDLPVGRPLHSSIGLEQTELAPIELTFEDGHALIAGPIRSGRSTALATIVRSLRASTPSARFVLLAPRRSPLIELEGWERVARGGSSCDELATELEALVDVSVEHERPWIIVVDDATELGDSSADDSLEKLARRGRDLGVRIVASAESSLARRAYGGVISEVRRDRQGILLCPDADLDGDLLNVDVPRSAPTFWVPGRAVVLSNGRSHVAQVAM